MYARSKNGMTTVISIVLLVAISLFVIRCSTSSAPKASFAVDATFWTAPLEVRFTDRSTGEITEWAWDFNSDGIVDSTDQNPSHIYNDLGIYSVSLTVTAHGESDTNIKTDCVEVQACGV